MAVAFSTGGKGDESADERVDGPGGVSSAHCCQATWGEGEEAGEEQVEGPGGASSAHCCQECGSPFDEGKMFLSGPS
ncbi:hypothetical protein T484DRAFT_1761570 [Baffinella frigidus]|nr:hypothetical protein T484DRAFT_1761570 [Cryptophyta sp. CCMP2293]